jgi:hypothetical protein
MSDLNIDIGHTALVLIDLQNFNTSANSRRIRPSAWSAIACCWRTRCATAAAW